MPKRTYHLSLTLRTVQCCFLSIVILVKEDTKKYSTHHNHTQGLTVPSNQSKKHLEKNNPCAVLGKKVYADLTKYGKKICAIGGSNLNRIKKNKFINGG